MLAKYKIDMAYSSREVTFQLAKQLSKSYEMSEYYRLHIQNLIFQNNTFCLLIPILLFSSSVPPKRVIIRQGHYAENFYFVISGSGRWFRFIVRNLVSYRIVSFA